MTRLTDKLQRVMNAAARCDHRHTQVRPRTFADTALNCNSSTCLSESCTSSASWCTAAYTVRRRSTRSTSAYQSRTSLLGSISGLPVDDSWSFRDTGCKRTADGLSLLLAHRPGTHCLTILETRALAETASANFWNRICSLVTETSSALEVLRECAIQIYLLTYLLNAGLPQQLLMLQIRRFRFFSSKVPAWQHSSASAMNSSERLCIKSAEKTRNLFRRMQDQLMHLHIGVTYAKIWCKSCKRSACCRLQCISGIMLNSVVFIVACSAQSL